MKSKKDLKKSIRSITKVSPKDRMDRIYNIKSMIYKQNSTTKTKIKLTGEVGIIKDPDEIRTQLGVNVEVFKQFTGREKNSPQKRILANQSRSHQRVEIT